jgi:hypothetical protein
LLEYNDVNGDPAPILLQVPMLYPGPGIPLLMLFTVTGMVVPGIRAIFWVPVIPGPEMKNANASL